MQRALRPNGDRVPDAIFRLYRTPVFSLDPDDRELAIRANNLGVKTIRALVKSDKAKGAQTVRVRWGLRLPVEWEEHYQAIYESDLPWFISGVLQNAFLGNPLQGERRKWRSL